MRQWYVEDAGGGCRAFSEVVVLVSELPREIYWSTIPLTWSNNQSLEEIVCQNVIELMAKAGVSIEDQILVCSGNIFFGYHHWLNDHDYTWSTVKMDGLAHEVAEGIFQHQIVAAGFPADIKLVNRNYRVFYRAVEDWVMEKPSRQRYLKDRRVREKPVETRYLSKGNGARVRKCSCCWGKILPFTPVVEYTHRENGKRIHRYYHLRCSPVKPLKSRLVEHTVRWQNETITGVLLAARPETCCTVCNELLQPGEPVFYGYHLGKLFCGHPGCLDNTTNTTTNITEISGSNDLGNRPDNTTNTTTNITRPLEVS
jgi:hypothetical protein